MTSSKGRYWGFIIYPESNPDFIEQSGESFLPLIISPLHDKDGVKPHYHCLLAYDGGVALSTVLKDVHLWGVSHVEPIRSKKAYIRYMTHDGTNKAKYNKEDIIDLTATGASESAVSYELIQLIISSDYTGLKPLCMELVQMNRHDLIAELKQHAYFYSKLV